MSSCSKQQPGSCHAGLTPVDVAINNKQVAIVRRLEHGAAFAGWLSQKVSKYVSQLTECHPKLAAAHVTACLCSRLWLTCQAWWLGECRYMGLGSEWSERWCVVMPRFPSVDAPANQQLTRSLLVIYKVCYPYACILAAHVRMLVSIV